jgi:tetratricopeptide (TPR) repeat protein
MKNTILLVVLSFLLQGCIQTIALRSMGGIMDNGFRAFNEESDLQLAHEALGSNIKLLEALIKSDPENKQFLLYAAQGYAAYALAFAEDDSVERARVFYLRAKNYGLRILTQNERFAQAIGKSDEDLKAALSTMGPDDVPALFWTALSWGSFVNITRTDINALADLGKVNAMIETVRKLDPTFYFGGPDMLAGAIGASTPASLGGKPEEARAAFERAIAVTGGRFLLVHVYFAKTYCAATLNQELFDQLLQHVADTPVDTLPGAEFANALAKRKALLLKAQESNLF